MPEMRFQIRWPDGADETCYSPSLVIKDHLAVGVSYSRLRFSRTQPHGADDRKRTCAREIRHSVLTRARPACAHRGPRTRFTPSPPRARHYRRIRRMIFRNPWSQPCPHLHRIIPSSSSAAVRPVSSISYHLNRSHIDHIVLEKNAIAHSWKTQRWDAFCLVTPNWQCQLPGFPYPGNDPKGFMLRDEIVAYVENYAKRIARTRRWKASGSRASGSNRMAAFCWKRHRERCLQTTSCSLSAAITYPTCPRVAERIDPTNHANPFVGLSQSVPASRWGGPCGRQRPVRLPDRKDLHLAGRKASSGGWQRAATVRASIAAAMRWNGSTTSASMIFLSIQHSLQGEGPEERQSLSHRT